MFVINASTGDTLQMSPTSRVYPQYLDSLQKQAVQCKKKACCAVLFKAFPGNNWRYLKIIIAVTLGYVSRDLGELFYTGTLEDQYRLKLCYEQGNLLILTRSRGKLIRCLSTSTCLLGRCLDAHRYRTMLDVVHCQQSRK